MTIEAAPLGAHPKVQARGGVENLVVVHKLLMHKLPSGSAASARGFGPCPPGLSREIFARRVASTETSRPTRTWEDSP
jgi:hypothetical protein